ncbi:hypothetical protein ACFZCP_05185 [Streptomyces sp. NPDC007971]|uniref:hypothetical protein n=1 Tax=Streptomyces sp. NPDC007971 TaxID=3364799 RepID=UPI0036E56487
MSDKKHTDNIHVTDEPVGKNDVIANNIHVTDEPLAADAKETGTASTDNIHVTDEPA